MNAVCKNCGRHWLSHVIYGPRGHGCQELVGDYEYGNCGCEKFIPTNGELIVIYEVLER